MKKSKSPYDLSKQTKLTEGPHNGTIERYVVIDGVCQWSHVDIASYSMRAGCCSEHWGAITAKLFTYCPHCGKKVKL